MADQQIEDLSELTAPASADEILVNDDSDTTDDAGGTPKRMSLATLRIFASELTLDDEYNAGVGNIAKTLVVGKLTPIDLGANNGGTLAANVVVTLPSASAGDVCGFFVTRSASAAGSFAQAPGYCAEIANATRINNAAYTSASTGSGKWGLWLPGEILVFRYLDTSYGSGTAGWYVEHDGRIPHNTAIKNTGAQTPTRNIVVKLTLDEADGPDNAGLAATSNNEIECKRAGKYLITGRTKMVSMLDQQRMQLLVYLDSGGGDTRWMDYGIVFVSDTSTPRDPMIAGAVVNDLSPANQLSLYVFYTDSSTDRSTAVNSYDCPRLSVMEQMQ